MTTEAGEAGGCADGVHGPSCAHVVMTGDDGVPRVAHVLMGGPDYRIEVNGEVIRFEDHPYCGPCPLNKRGKELRLGPRHKFWSAVTWWYQQGKQLDPVTGRCVYRDVSREEELIGEDNELVHLGGRHHYIVPKGTDHEAFKAELLRKALERKP